MAARMRKPNVYYIAEDYGEQYVLFTGDSPRFGVKNEKKDDTDRAHAAYILRQARERDEDGEREVTVTRRKPT